MGKTGFEFTLLGLSALLVLGIVSAYSLGGYWITLFFAIIIVNPLLLWILSKKLTDKVEFRRVKLITDHFLGVSIINSFMVVFSINKPTQVLPAVINPNGILPIILFIVLPVVSSWITLNIAHKWRKEV